MLGFSGEGVDQLADDAVTLLESMAIHAASAIEAARLHERTSAMAVTDVLTGLGNRRRFDDDLRLECAASTRYERPLSMLMIDIDHFKAYNDTFGHPAGDRVVQIVGHILDRSRRASDFAYRYGGEEYAFVLRETNESEALTVAERIRAAVEHHFNGPEEPRQVTISVGAASLSGRVSTPDTLVSAADAALYEAKQTGRNRVVAAGELTDTVAAVATAAAEDLLR